MVTEVNTHPLCPFYDPSNHQCLQQAKIEGILATVENNPALEQALRRIENERPSLRNKKGLCSPNSKTLPNKRQQLCSFRERADVLSKVFSL